MRRVLPLLAIPLLLLPGCRMNERMTGTVGGAAAGGLVGGLAAGTLGGFVVGTAGGALVGYLIGDYLCDQSERCMTPQQSPCAVPQGYDAAPTYAATTMAPAARVETRTPRATPAASSALSPARIAYERGRTAATAEEARAAYQESIRLDPTRPEPWNALALHALAAGDRAAARADLQRALALDPAYAPARLNLASLDAGM